MKKLNIFIFTVVGLFVLNTGAFAQDRNFYIFICFGQSNMQGAAPIESQDMTINNRFKVFQAQDCPNLNRKKLNRVLPFHQYVNAIRGYHLRIISEELWLPIFRMILQLGLLTFLLPAVTLGCLTRYLQGFRFDLQGQMVYFAGGVL